MIWVFAVPFNGVNDNKSSLNKDIQSWIIAVATFLRCRFNQCISRMFANILLQTFRYRGYNHEHKTK